MGPMYHLLEESERIKCMESALNLLKPEGIIYVSFISLYAGFSCYMKNDPNLIKEDGENEYIKCYLDNKTYCGDAFTKACFITPNEILPFMERFNLKKLHLLGQEGITSMCENNIYACVKEIIDKWIDIAIKTCERKEFYALSEHIMYIGKSN